MLHRAGLYTPDPNKGALLPNRVLSVCPAAPSDAGKAFRQLVTVTGTLSVAGETFWQLVTVTGTLSVASKAFQWLMTVTGTLLVAGETFW